MFEEFKRHLRGAGFDSEHHNQKKYIVKFTRAEGEHIMCIFGTADSLMYSLSDNLIQGTDRFLSLVRTIHAHGPTKLVGPKVALATAASSPGDDASGSVRRRLRHHDGHVPRGRSARRSALFENNLLTRVREYREKPAAATSIPSFPTSRIVTRAGDRVRRFNHRLVDDFRNVVMAAFHENPSHNSHIPIPVAAPEVAHTRAVV